MEKEKAECDNLSGLLAQVTKHIERFQRFKHVDAVQNKADWLAALNIKLPQHGIGADRVIKELGLHVIPNGSQIAKPGCTSYITTAGTDIAAVATLAGNSASPQRVGITAFNFLESLALQWLAEMLGIPADMQGILSSGGSTANLIGLGAARQRAFENIGLDPANDGVQRACRIYATEHSHHTIHRSAAVLGMGRNSVVHIPVDKMMRMSIPELKKQLEIDKNSDTLPVAIVANAGSTNTGSIDPLAKIAAIAADYNIWFHIDGAYGLPGTLDPAVHDLYKGLELADSITVDPHKWLGASVGIGATFVRDIRALQHTFSQGDADYLDTTTVEDEKIENSMDSIGYPYHDLGVELSAPARGVVVWALLREIGVEGMKARVCRHNAMAKWLAEQANNHPNLELILEPTLSICCFRYVHKNAQDLNQLNKNIHRQLMKNGVNIPSTTQLDGQYVIRPCFLGARTAWHHAEDLLNEVLEIGNKLIS